jgi:rhodanese-related sulfurtransferase
MQSPEMLMANNGRSMSETDRNVRASVKLAVILMLAIGAIACQPPKQEILVSELIQTRSSQPKILIDVRSPVEYERDRIGDSFLMPIEELLSQAGVARIQARIAAVRVATGQSPPVILYCQRGARSARAQAYLAATGIDTISLAGGIQAWRRAIPPEQDAAMLRTIGVARSGSRAYGNEGKTPTNEFQAICPNNVRMCSGIR